MKLDMQVLSLICTPRDDRATETITGLACWTCRDMPLAEHETGVCNQEYASMQHNAEMAWGIPHAECDACV